MNDYGILLEEELAGLLSKKEGFKAKICFIDQTTCPLFSFGPDLLIYVSLFLKRCC